MKIIVCIKQVPDTSDVQIDPETNTLIRSGIPSIINPDDRSGIEAALNLRDMILLTAQSLLYPWGQPRQKWRCEKRLPWAAIMLI